jgi:hypothetical protein
MDTRMNIEIINQIKERSEKFLAWIELTVDDPNAIKAAIAFFEYNESALKAVIKMAQIDLAASSLIEVENKSIQRVLSQHSIDLCLDSKKAREQLVLRLTKVVNEGYTFNGIYLENGKNKIWD